MYYKQENVPSVQSSSNLKGPGGFIFELWSCVISLKNSESIDNTALIVGYLERGVGDYYYIVIPNSITGSSEVKYRIVEQDVLESKFTSVDRPTFGILKTPQVGDIVMCVAKGRYTGVQGGETKEVLSMPGGRLNIYKDSQSTYEDTFFVVCHEFAANTSKTPSPVKKRDDSEDISRYFDFGILLNQDKVKKRVVLEAEKIIVRKKIEEPEIKKRQLFNPETIKKFK